MYKPDKRKVPIKLLEWGMSNNLGVVRTFLYLKFYFPSHFHHKDRSSILAGLEVSERTLTRHLGVLAREGWVNVVGRGQNCVVYVRSFRYLHKIIGTPFQSRIEMSEKFLNKKYFTSWVFRSLVTRMVRYYERNKNIDEVSRHFLRPDGSKLRGIDISVRYLADVFGTSATKIQRIKSVALKQGAVIRIKNGHFVEPEMVKPLRKKGVVVRKASVDFLKAGHEGHYVPLPDTLLPVTTIDYCIDHDVPFVPFNSITEDGGRIYDLWQINKRQVVNFEKVDRRGKYSVAIKERLRERCRKMIVDWFEGYTGKYVSARFEEAVKDSMHGWKFEEAIETLRNKEEGWQKLITVRPGIPWATFNFGGRWAFSPYHKGMKDQVDFWIKPYCRTHWEALLAIDPNGRDKLIKLLDEWIDFDWEWLKGHYPDLDKSPLSDEARLEIWTRFSPAGEKPTLSKIKSLLASAQAQAPAPSSKSIHTDAGRAFGNVCTDFDKL